MWCLDRYLLIDWSAYVANEDSAPSFHETLVTYAHNLFQMASFCVNEEECNDIGKKCY